MLAGQKDFSGARSQFDALLNNSPNNAEIAVTAGMMSMQAKDFEAAQSYLTRALKLNPKDPNPVRFR